MYIAGHHAFVAWAPEVGTITESANGTTPASLPTVPTTINLIGYTNVPEHRRGLNNGWGDAAGLPYHAYRKRGAVTPSVNMTLRAGSVDFLENAILDDGVLPWFALYIGVPGVWTDVHRFCKLGDMTITGRESQAEASEIEFQCNVQSTAVQTLASPLDPDTSALLALGDPLFWHDARVLTQETSANAIVNLRSTMMSFSAKIDLKLERKASRPNWGDNQPLSRTSYDMLEHIPDLSGDFTLHDRLPASLVNATANSLDWGDFVLGISNLGATKVVNLTMQDVFPSDIVGAATEPSAQQSHSVQWSARNYVFSTVG